MTLDDDRSWRPHPTSASGDDGTDEADTFDDGEVDRWFDAGDPDGSDGPDRTDGEDLPRVTGYGDESVDAVAGSDAAPSDQSAAPAKRRRGRKPKAPSGDPGLAIFVDSSALIALVDRDDATHSAATSAYTELVTQGYKLFTTNYVIAETFDLLSAGVGQDIARRFLRDCKIGIYHADEQDERRAKRVILRQTGPNGLSLTDAISFVVMERLGVGDAFAVDPNFLSNAP